MVARMVAALDLAGSEVDPVDEPGASDEEAADASESATARLLRLLEEEAGTRTSSSVEAPRSSAGGPRAVPPAWLQLHGPNLGGFSSEAAPFFGKEDEACGDAPLWSRGIAVDLGSSTMRVATWSGAEVTIHPELAQPAYVAFTAAGKVLLGHEAKSAAQQNSGNAFHVGALLRRLHPQCEADTDGCGALPAVTVASVAGQPREMLVAELFALLLWRLREVVQDHLGAEPLRSLVLSVPAVCSLVPRRTLEEAAQLAGFERARLLQAPVGATLWRCAATPERLKPQHHSAGAAQTILGPPQPLDEKQVLLVDVGSGHLDCALVVVEFGVFEVRRAGGSSCGGADIDEHLARLCMDRVGRPAGELPSQRLLAACEKAKRCLSTAQSTRINVPRLWGEESLDLTVTVRDLDDILRREILPKLTRCVRDLIERRGQRTVMLPDRRDIDEVLLLGGTFKIPCVQKAFQELTENGLRVREVFTHQTPIQGGANAFMHAHAYGAALQGAVLGHRRGERNWLQSLMLIDSCSHSLGIAVEDQTTCVVLAHTPIPTTKDVSLRLKDPSQPGAIIHIREEDSEEGSSGGRSAWLGAIAVPASSWQDDGAEKPPASQDGTATEPMLHLTVEVDAAGRLHVEVAGANGQKAPALFCGRRSALSEKELALIATELRTQAADKWARYGQRAALPRRPELDRGRSRWPSWSVEIVGRVDDDIDGEETGVGDEDSSPQSPPEPPPAATAPAAAKEPPPRPARRSGDPRAQAYAQRLRRKMDERRQQNGHGQDKAGEEHAAAAGGEGAGTSDWHQQLSTTEVCAVCLCTEAELGRPFPWVFEKCGHKCICKNCLRKWKARHKRAQVECPLCRVQSKPVLRERYEGDIFAAEADP